MTNETINDPRLEEGVWTTDPESGELVPDYESTFPTIEEGQVVNGTVVRVDKDEVLVDIGYKSEGVIPVAELSIRRSVNPADEVSVGDDIAALVLTKEDAEGRLILSKKRARFELAWKAIEIAHENGEPVTGRVIEVVKGGLILDLGVRGFLPASLVDIRRVQDLDEFIGQELECKVIELNRSRNNVVLSRRAVLEEERKEQRQRILDQLNPGDIVEGRSRTSSTSAPSSTSTGWTASSTSPSFRGATSTIRRRCSRSGRRSRCRCSTSTASASGSRSASSRRRATRGSRCSTRTRRATSSRGR